MLAVAGSCWLQPEPAARGEVGGWGSWIFVEGVAFSIHFLTHGFHFWCPRRFGDGIYWRRGRIFEAVYAEGVAFLMPHAGQVCISDEGVAFSTHFLSKGSHFCPPRDPLPPLLAKIRGHPSGFE